MDIPLSDFDPVYDPLVDDFSNKRSPGLFRLVFVTVIVSTLTSTLAFFVLLRSDLYTALTSVDVPSLIGMSESDARLRLQKEGLGMILAEPKADSSARAGSVIEQTPKAKSAVPEHANVTVVLAQEPLEVPSVVGLTLAEATRAIEQNGFQLQMGEAVVHPEIQKGNVATQLPQAGSSCTSGCTITLAMSNGSELRKVPKLVGLKLRKAKKAILEAGFQVGDIRWSSKRKRPRFVVLKQNPEKDQEAEPKTKIDLAVNEG